MQTTTRISIAGVVSIAIAIVVSFTTDDSVGWAWDAMALSTLVGVVLLGAAAIVAVARRRRARERGVVDSSAARRGAR